MLSYLNGALDPCRFTFVLYLLCALPCNASAPSEKFSHYKQGGGKATLSQFPVTLAYAITDYKCQGKTFSAVVCDLKRPSGLSAPTSGYVQLSRARTLQNVSIMRPFDEEELRRPLDQDLLEELAWQERMAEHTAQVFGNI